jgi:hypothetical protein
MIIALIVCMLFLWMTVFSPPSAFNFLPYLIHKSFSTSFEGEAEFIKGFDIAFAILLFFIVYKIANRLLTRREV